MDARNCGGIQRTCLWTTKHLIPPGDSAGAQLWWLLGKVKSCGHQTSGMTLKSLVLRDLPALPGDSFELPVPPSHHDPQ